MQSPSLLPERPTHLVRERLHQVRQQRAFAGGDEYFDRHAGQHEHVLQVDHHQGGVRPDQLIIEVQLAPHGDQPLGAIVVLSDGGDNTGGIDRDTIAKLNENFWSNGCRTI